MVESRKQMESNNYFQSQLRMMIWMGMNRPLVARPIVHALFIIRAVLVVVIYVALMIGCIAHMRMVTEFNLVLSSTNVLQLIVYVIGILNISYYQIRNEAVHCMIIKARKAFRLYSNTGHFTMDEPVRLDTRRSIGWTVLCAIATTGWFALTTARGEDSVPVWAPVNLRASPYYETDIFLQFTAQFTMGTLGGCFGSFFISVLSLLKYQFDMLSCSLEHVAHLAVLKTQKKIRDENGETSGAIASEKYAGNFVGNDIKSSRQCECCTKEFERFFAIFERRRLENSLTELEARVYEEELLDILKDCVVHYQKIVQFGDEAQDFFGPVLLIRFILSTMMQCFTIYNLSEVMAMEDFSLMDARIARLLEYYAMAVGEMFIFCYIADHLSRSSALIPNVAYERLPWHGGGVTTKFLSNFKIFHLRAMKPTSLRTPFYVISLNILTTMIRMSFSFYTVLRRLQ